MTDTPTDTTSPAVTPDAAQFRKRTAILFYIYAGACAIILARIAYLATFQQEQHDALVNAASWAYDIMIPGIRGKIIASDGQILASSERRLNVIWHVPKNYNVAEASWRELSAFSWAEVPSHQELQDLPGKNVIVARNLLFDDPVLWETMLSMPELQPVVYFKRWKATMHPECQWLGETITDPVSGLELGICGMEKLYDEQLRAGTSKCSLLKGGRNVVTEGSPLNGSNVILLNP